jgi:hypothetical protein
LLDLPDAPLATQPGKLYRLRPLARFNHHVLAPAGWGPRVRGKDWKALAAPTWLATPSARSNHRLRHGVFGLGSTTRPEPRRSALADQEASMLDLVKSDLTLSPVRDPTAIREAQAHGLVIADQVNLACDLSFICLAARASKPVVARACDALDAVWA